MYTARLLPNTQLGWVHDSAINSGYGQNTHRGIYTLNIGPRVVMNTKHEPVDNSPKFIHDVKKGSVSGYTDSREIAVKYSGLSDYLPKVPKLSNTFNSEMTKAIKNSSQEYDNR